MTSRKVVLPTLLLTLAAGLGVSARVAQSQSAAATKKTAPGTPSAHKSSSKTPSKKGQKSLRKQPGQKVPTADRISEIQSALAKEGSFSGAPNGKWDDSTVSAMKKYQAEHGLNPSGKLDALTLQKLGLGGTTAGVAAPTPPMGATSRLTSSSSSSTTAKRQQ
jgi:peptidoglycan hydrolase-like protein with peptidoglycan-binding domain